MRRAAKRDANESAIVKVLRSAGVSVLLIDQPFDALLHFRGRTYLGEFKDPKKQGWKDEFTAAQKAFFAAYPGWPVQIFRTPDDAIAFVNGEST